MIKGARFGQEGMVRVCNLCLDKLAKVDDDDEDDDDDHFDDVRPASIHEFQRSVG